MKLKPDHLLPFFEEAVPDWYKPGDIKILTKNETLDLLTFDPEIGVLFNPFRLYSQLWWNNNNG